MRPGAFVPFAIAAVLLAGCTHSTSGSPGDRSSSTDPVTLAPTVSPPTTSSSTAPAPITVPADVPTTGPNLLRTGERPPVMPALATQRTRDGAVAFAKFFIQTIDWGFATTSSTYMDHYFSPRCESCAAFSDSLKKAQRTRETFVGGRFNIHGTRAAPPNVQRGQRAAKITCDLGALVTFDARHVFLNAQPGRKSAAFFVSEDWVSDHWIVTWLSVAV